MSELLAFVRWEEYQKRPDGLPLLAADPVSFNSAQARLHRVLNGERLWLVSRCPDDQEYYLVGFIKVEAKELNPPDSVEAQLFGTFRVVGRKATSADLGKRCVVTDLLYALSFSPRNPIKPGANIGQSIQTIRKLSHDDVSFLDRLVEEVLATPRPTGTLWNPVVGLWTKCSGQYALRFLENYEAQKRTQAFLLYDAQPWLPEGAPIFVHADRRLTLFARFFGSEAVRGYMPLYDQGVRDAERERIWALYRSNQRFPIEGTKENFDRFWSAKRGVRSLIHIGDVSLLPRRPSWTEYGSKLLQWGMPTCVGYRHLTLRQAKALSEASGSPLTFRAIIELVKNQ